MSTDYGVYRVDDIFYTLYVVILTVGNYRFPTSDSTAGQVLTTNGAGILSFQTNAGGDVTGPASSTDNAITRFDGVTGKLIQNSTATLSDGGVITSSGLVNAGITYPTVDKTVGQVVTTNGAGVLSFNSVSIGDHLAFNSVNFSVGVSITLDTTTAYTNTANVASRSYYTSSQQNLLPCC